MQKEEDDNKEALGGCLCARYFAVFKRVCWFKPYNNPKK